MKERPLVEDARDGPPGLPQPVVGVFRAPLGRRPLLKEVAPEGAPVHEPLDPEIRLVEGLYAQEVPGEGVELYPRLELRPRGRVAPDLAEHVEEASLDPGVGPGLPRRLGEPRSAVGDDHLGRRDAAEEPPP